MARGWMISCVLFVVIGISAAAPSLWDHIPDAVLRTFEEENHIIAGSTRKEKLFQLKCGTTLLPTGDGEVEVELSAYDPDFELIVDGESVDPKTLGLNTLYKGTVAGGGGVVAVECDTKGFIKVAEVTLDGLLSGVLMPLHGDHPGVLAFVDPGTIDTSAIGDVEMGHLNAPVSMDKSSRVSAGRGQDMYVPLEKKETTVREEVREETALPDLAARGADDRRLTIAVAFDQTICARYGSLTNAINAVRSIYTMASTRFYENFLNLELEVTTIEGTCSSSNYDNMFPRESGCNGNGYLQNVENFWNANRRNVPRDLVGFITNRGFTDGNVVGCAYLSNICGDAGYGANTFQFSQNQVLLENLIAHETGHNCGADHAPDGFMFGSLRLQNDQVEVHPNTISEVRAEVSRKSRCLPFNGMCTNAFLQAASCECETGYTFFASSGSYSNSCVDQNECDVNPNICGNPNYVCTNLNGSYRCTCPAGEICTDVCPDGYILDNGSCVDVDECAENTDNCGSAQCFNTPGGFTCGCPEGYELSNSNCVDINECSDGTDNCGANAICVNSAGSFSCECPDGYSPDGLDCVPDDVPDQCLPDPCHTDFECLVDGGDVWCVCWADCYFRQRRTFKGTTCNCDPNCKLHRQPCTKGSECCSLRCNKRRGFCRS